MKKLLACALISLGLIPAAGVAFDNVSPLPPVSHTDLFEDALIINSTAFYPGSSGDGLFGGPGFLASGQVIFNDDQTVLEFVNFDTTGGADTVVSFRIIFQQDSEMINRAAASFSLFADLNADFTYETLLFSGPVLYTAGGGFFADITVNLPVPITADLFQLQIVPTNAGAFTGGFTGVRVWELDAFGPAQVSEPQTLALMALGLGSLFVTGIRARRRRLQGLGTPLTLTASDQSGAHHEEGPHR